MDLASKIIYNHWILALYTRQLTGANLLGEFPGIHSRSHIPECSSGSHINMYLRGLFLIALIRLEMNPRGFCNSGTLNPYCPLHPGSVWRLNSLSYLSRHVETKARGLFSCGNLHWFEEKTFMKISWLISWIVTKLKMRYSASFIYS